MVRRDINITNDCCISTFVITTYDFCRLESVENKQIGALQKWQEFEDQLESHTRWFRSMEAAFRDQQLQPTLKDKENQLSVFKDKRESITKQEREIDEFVDRSHGLLHSSGVDRLKPLISQISNR